MPELDISSLLPLIRQALQEDVGPGDATTAAIIPPGLSHTASLVAREPLTVAGLPVAAAVFAELDKNCHGASLVPEGATVTAGTALMQISGPAAALLTGERVALNFVQRLSGIATMTAEYVKAAGHTPTQILDTRKTTPGWRALEKYAVACGGGVNHRLGLFDLIMIKDNHLAALAGAQPNPIEAAVALARKKYPQLRVEVEADSLSQVEQALRAGADIILLDNMTCPQMSEAVRLVGDRCKTEASGGITLDRIAQVAATGVHSISVGALTHSVRACDIALDFAPMNP